MEDLLGMEGAGAILFLLWLVWVAILPEEKTR